MAKTLSEFGRIEYSRIDSTIYSSKAFVQVWRVASALEKIQFLDFLNAKAEPPEIFLGILDGLGVLRDSCGGDSYDFISTAHLIILNLQKLSRGNYDKA